MVALIGSGCLDDTPVLDGIDEYPVFADGLVVQWSFRGGSLSGPVPPDLGECGPDCLAYPVGFSPEPWQTAWKGSGLQESPSAHGGRSVQLDGENDHFRIPDRGELLYGRTAFTLEFRLRIGPEWPPEAEYFEEAMTLFSSADWQSPQQRTMTLEIGADATPSLTLWPANPSQRCPALSDAELDYEEERGCVHDQHDVDDDGLIPCQVDLKGNAPVPIDRWFVLTITWERDGDALLYIDGEQVLCARSSVAAVGESARDWIVGAAEWGESATVSPFSGHIDVFRVYRAALSPARVALSAAALQEGLSDGATDPAGPECSVAAGAGCARGTPLNTEWSGVSLCRADDTSVSALACAEGHSPCTIAHLVYLTPNRFLWELEGGAYMLGDAGWAVDDQPPMLLTECGRRSCLPSDDASNLAGLACCSNLCGPKYP